MGSTCRVTWPWILGGRDVEDEKWMGILGLGVGEFFLGVHPSLLVFFIGEFFGVPSIFCVCVFCLGVCYVTFR